MEVKEDFLRRWHIAWNLNEKQQPKEDGRGEESIYAERAVPEKLEHPKHNRKVNMARSGEQKGS